MKINLIFNKYIPDYKKALEKIEQALLSYKVEFKTFDLEKMEYFGDITFVIGGDGTLLRAARFYAKENVPVLGINVGRLGFLAQAGVDDIINILAYAFVKAQPDMANTNMEYLKFLIKKN